MNLIINTDGASRGNPGPASYGFVIKDVESGEVIHKEGRVIGVATNNIAEYSGVLGALEYVKKSFSGEAPHKINIVADSLLIVRQLAGLYRIKNPKLRILFDRIKELEEEVGEVLYKQVPRAQNSAADRMANLALDKDR